MGVPVCLREMSAYARLKMFTVVVEKLPGPQFGVHLMGGVCLQEVELY